MKSLSDYEARVGKMTPDERMEEIARLSREGPEIDLFDPKVREQAKLLLSGQKLRRKPGQSATGYVGRPYLRADMPVSSVEFHDLRMKYYDIIRRLSHREAMAICRALNYSYSTFLMRKYCHRQPKLEEVILVTDWFDRGKPTITKQRYVFALFEPITTK